MTDKLRGAATQALEVLDLLQGAACKELSDKQLAQYIRACSALRTALAEQHTPKEVPKNPYAAQGSLAEAWRRGYEGRPVLASPGSNYARVYWEGVLARKEANLSASRQEVRVSEQWPISKDPLTQLQLTAVISARDDRVSTTMALVENYAKAVHDGDDAACSVLRQTIKASLEQAAPTPPAQQDAQAVQQGWKLTPVEPTPEMRKAAADAWIDCGDRLILNKAAAALRAGIAAAPTPPAQAATCKQCLQVDALLDDMLDTLPYNSPDYWIGRIREVRYGTPCRRNNHD